MKISLKFKAVAVVLLFVAVLSAGIVLISYNTYTQAFNRHYQTLAVSIAKSTATAVDKEKVEKITSELLRIYNRFWYERGEAPDFGSFSDTDWDKYYQQFDPVTSMPEYAEIWQLLDQLRIDNNVVSLYLGYTDLKTMKDLYVVDASADTRCMPGDWDDADEEYAARIAADKYDIPAFITNTEEYGWLCSATAPLITKDGRVIGTALVDISMNEIMENRMQFLVKLTLITLAAAAVMVIIILILVNKAVIHPINLLNDAASSFVSGKKGSDTDGVSKISKLNIQTGDEMEKLSKSIKKMEEELNTYITELTAVTAEKERISAELDVAQNIQSSMLPYIFPAFPDRQEFDIYASMTPAKEVGGDFYDFFMVDDQHLAVVVADVSGKGVPAALFMVIAKTLIKGSTVPDKDLGAVFTEVNNLLCESNSEGLFVTAFEGVLNLVTGEFHFVNAGHELPYICKKGSRFEAYKIRAGFVLAGMEDMRYRAGKITLEEGDKLFEYTDGVTEATNSSNELYGMERLGRILNKNFALPPQELVHAVKENVDSFTGEAGQFDDITMLCLEYKKRMILPE